MGAENFRIYGSIFKSFGNDDFDRFFGGNSPESETNFYLFTNCLKFINPKYPELYVF
jgi:hypothetical protein